MARTGTVPVNIKVTFMSSVSIAGHKSIRCYCGRWVSGRRDLVEEAHRQHLLHHEPDQ